MARPFIYNKIYIEDFVPRFAFEYDIYTQLFLGFKIFDTSN